MAHFEKLFIAAPDAYLVLRADDAFTVITATDAYLRIANIIREQILGRSVFEVLAENASLANIVNVPAMRASLKAVIATRERQLVDLPRQAGQPHTDSLHDVDARHWRALNVPVLSADGTVEEVIHRLEDITTLVRLEQLRRQQRDHQIDRQTAAAGRERLLESERAARAEAERTSRLKDEFLATLSHELRTPLNAILGWTQVLQEGVFDKDELVQGLEVIDRNTRLQAELIEDLLDMSRIVSGKVRLELKQIDVSTVVQSAINSVRTTAEGKNIRLHLTRTTRPVKLMADSHRLHQILLNLLSNAIKFTPRGGFVEVSIASTPAHVDITVRDNGIGIRREFLPHAFERFRQTDATTTRQHGGLGLGLSIVKHLVELHSGQVNAESAGKDQGSAFRVSLPRTPIKMPTPEPPDFANPVNHRRMHIDLSGIKVLVVDDEPDSAGLVKRVLEGCHAEVQAAGSMDEALEVFSFFRPHILLSDISMPHHDGYELIRRVRELPGGRDVPAAALTALVRSEDVDRALHAGFQTHVPKPVEPSELVTVTARLADRDG